MNGSPLPIIMELLEIAWRRRYLILIPMLVMIPLSALFAIFAPKTYVARTLLLLQETSRDDILGKNSGSPVRMQDGFGGLQALLQSDYVLESAVKEFYGSEIANDPKMLAYKVKDFEDALSLELVGNDFLELTMKGSQPDALGRKLEAVTLSFLESTLSDQGAISATRMLLEKRKEEMETTERSYEQLRSQAEEKRQLASGKSALIGKIEQDLQAKRSELETADREKNLAIGELEAKGFSTVELPQQIETVSLQLEALRRGDGQGSVEASEQHLVLLRNVVSKDQQRASLQREVDKLTAAITQAELADTEAGNTDNLLKSKAEDLHKAQDRYQDFLKRYSNAATKRTLGILNAPERIKVIDPPRDPKVPAKSGLRYFLAGSMASLILGIALVVLAEMFDTRIRRPADVIAITGSPVVVRLPHIVARPGEAHDERIPRGAGLRSA